MKMIFMTDSHFRAKTPVSRTDNFFESLLKKFKWVLKFAKKQKAFIVHGGDFFDSPRVADYVAVAVADLIYKYKVHIYCILGQHDLIGKNIDSYEQTKMGIFKRLKYFHLIGNKVVIKGSIAIHGLDFDKENPVPNTIHVDRVKKKFNIVVVHGLIADRDLNVRGKDKLIEWNRVVTNADLLLSGDYHPGYGYQFHTLIGAFCNPGSFARLSTSDGKEDRKPCLGIFEFSKSSMTDWSVQEIPCIEQPFNLKALAKEVTAQEEKDKFLKALNELSRVEVAGENVLKMLDTVDKYPKDIVKKCKEKVESLNV